MSLTIAAGAAAKGFSADLRVVGSSGKILTEKTLATATTSVKTSPKATCFGAGTGGSGDSVSIQGNTALGLLARGSLATSSLKPLLISDSFDFGLALCGVGSSVAKGSSSWYLKVNHKAASVSADAAKIKAGDDVLFALAESDPKTYAYPDELWLSAPAKATAGMAFTVRAYSYDEKGKRKPASGVKVSGASGPTAADGKTTVTLSKPSQLLATKGDLIPSRAAVCIGGKCPAGS
ncbi:MAG: hypothetical protein JJE35_12355 [Thermoleophilia bacterium]|nr:hypothetical protein [Thermoleophilia bacterium]